MYLLEPTIRFYFPHTLGFISIKSQPNFDFGYTLGILRTNPQSNFDSGCTLGLIWVNLKLNYDSALTLGLLRVNLKSNVYFWFTSYTLGIHPANSKSNFDSAFSLGFIWQNPNLTLGLLWGLSDQTHYTALTLGILHLFCGQIQTSLFILGFLCGQTQNWISSLFWLFSATRLISALAILCKYFGQPQNRISTLSSLSGILLWNPKSNFNSGYTVARYLGLS